MTGGYCTEGGAWTPIEINGKPVIGCICKKCGHIEFFSKEALAKYNKDCADKKKADIAKQVAAKRYESLKKELKQLEDVIKDENQTVKAVKDAKERIEKVRKELSAIYQRYHF